MNWNEIIHTDEISRSDARSKEHPQPPQPHRQPKFGYCLARISDARAQNYSQVLLYFCALEVIVLYLE